MAELTEEQKQNRELIKKHWKKILIIGILFFAVVGFYGFVVNSYNNFVITDQEIKEAWANIEVSYQQRYDLTGTLIEVVKSTKEFEAGLLTDITNARSAWASAEGANEKVKAANAIDSSISKLLFVAENYPDLKTNESFLALQDQLTIIENQIADLRVQYNYKVGTYNVWVNYFPDSIVASTFGFKENEYFKSKEGTEEKPEIKI